MSAAVPATSPAVDPNRTVVRTTWRGERRYEIAKNDASAMIDCAGVDGLGPVDTMLGALAACASTDVVGYFVKRRSPAESLTVTVSAVRRAEAPRRVLSATLEFDLRGDGIDDAHADRAIALAVDSYCSVASSLAPDLAIDLRVALNGQPGRAVVRPAGDRPA